MDISVTLAFLLPPGPSQDAARQTSYRLLFLRSGVMSLNQQPGLALEKGINGQARQFALAKVHKSVIKRRREAFWNSLLHCSCQSFLDAMIGNHERWCLSKCKQLSPKRKPKSRQSLKYDHTSLPSSEFTMASLWLTSMGPVELKSHVMWSSR